MKTYTDLFKALKVIIPDLEQLPQGISRKSRSGGFMDLNLDFLYREQDGAFVIALSHYYRQNGDSIADPDMTIRVYPQHGIAEALTYQDARRYDEVYPAPGKVNPFLKKSLNSFLRMWLDNLKSQGHRLTPETADAA